jgi:hypothetical protein
MVDKEDKEYTKRTVAFTCSDVEFGNLKAAAGGGSVSGYVKELVFKKRK